MKVNYINGNMKKKIILVGPFVGELYWEYFRFAPYVFKKNINNYPLVVLSRLDRYDIYGERCCEFIPLNIDGDSINKFGECFRMTGMLHQKYYEIVSAFKLEMDKKYNVITHFFPPFKKPDFTNKKYYPLSKRLFEYLPRKENDEAILKFLKDIKKPIILLAPRYRKNFKRNWPYWQKLYNKIYDSKWDEKFEFVICGKENEYVSDKYNRFKDINQIPINDNISLFGLLLSLMKYVKLTIGSQSAIPNISLLNKVKAIEWGNQKHLHTVTYNIYNTPVIFFNSPNFDIDMIKIFDTISIELNNILRNKTI